MAIKLDCRALPNVDVFIYCTVPKAEDERVIAFRTISHALTNNSSLDKKEVCISISSANCQVTNDSDSPVLAYWLMREISRHPHKDPPNMSVVKLDIPKLRILMAKDLHGKKPQISPLVTYLTCKKTICTHPFPGDKASSGVEIFLLAVSTLLSFLASFLALQL